MKYPAANFRVQALQVAPFTGAWIEIRLLMSDPSKMSVAPFTGAWIEIILLRRGVKKGSSRTLHGCVD